MNLYVDGLAGAVLTSACLPASTSKSWMRHDNCITHLDKAVCTCNIGPSSQLAGSLKPIVIDKRGHVTKIEVRSYLHWGCSGRKPTASIEHLW